MFKFSSSTHFESSQAEVGPTPPVAVRELTGPAALSTVDWDRPDWGGRVHHASNGSWVPDRHGVAS